MEALLAIRGVDITRQLRRADMPFRLRIYTLRLERGERLGVVGPSGSGKSTLLDFAALLTWPNVIDSFLLRDPDNTELDLASAIRQRQSDLLTDARARCIGYVVQNGALLPYLSVAANAMLAARLAGQPTRVSRERLARYSKRLGIHGLLDRLPARLSGISTTVGPSFLRSRTNSA